MVITLLYNFPLPLYYTPNKRPSSAMEQEKRVYGPSPLTDSWRLFALFRKTTIYGLGRIPAPSTKLGARYVHVHNRPGLCFRMNVKSPRERLDVTVVLRPSREELERQNILKFRNVHCQVCKGFPLPC